MLNVLFQHLLYTSVISGNHIWILHCYYSNQSYFKKKKIINNSISLSNHSYVSSMPLWCIFPQFFILGFCSYLFSKDLWLQGHFLQLLLRPSLSQCLFLVQSQVFLLIKSHLFIIFILSGIRLLSSCYFFSSTLLLSPSAFIFNLFVFLILKHCVFLLRQSCPCTAVSSDEAF